jgi:hypothetical protein
MLSLYALSSTMNFVDAERLRESHQEAKACVTAGSFSRSTFQRFTHRWT